MNAFTLIILMSACAKLRIYSEQNNSICSS